tara:strand:- start:2268 stop:4121 length:1854 start_codon:yes stop_codon:yes gene_type:complete
MQTPSRENLFFGLDISPINNYFENIRKKITSSELIFEFKKSSLNYGLAKLKSEEVNFTFINKVEIDDESAIDRGAPTNPDLMAGLLKSIISSEKIYAHKARVIIPPEAAYNKTIFLPENLTEKDVREYILDPKTEYKIPVPIRQTDFSLIPNHQMRKINGQLHNGYFLSSIPKKITNQIMKTLDLAELDLSDIELAFTCHSRLYFSEIRDLLEDEFLIVLDLNSDCTHLCIYSTYSYMQISKIAAIRNQNENHGSKDDSEINENISLSKIDIQIMCNELEAKMNEFMKINVNAKWTKIILCGPNSLHPNLSKLLQSEYNIPVNVLVANLSNHVGEVSFQYGNDIHNYTNIIGSGLGLIDINIRNKGYEREIVKKSLSDSIENSYLLDYSSPRNVGEIHTNQGILDSGNKSESNLESNADKSNGNNLNFSENTLNTEPNKKEKTKDKEEQLSKNIDNKTFSQQNNEKNILGINQINSIENDLNFLEEEENWPSINQSIKEESINHKSTINMIKDEDNISESTFENDNLDDNLPSINQPKKEEENIISEIKFEEDNEDENWASMDQSKKGKLNNEEFPYYKNDQENNSLEIKEININKEANSSPQSDKNLSDEFEMPDF